MGKVFLFVFIVFGFLQNELITGSRIRIVNNGYENIVVALPKAISVDESNKLTDALQRLFQQSSLLLTEGTKGRAYFRSVVFLVPQSWGNESVRLPDGELNVAAREAGASINRADADIVVTDEVEEEYPYTLHHAGCGRRASRIYIPTSFLITDPQEQNIEKFAHLWSEYRYGIFLEKGFEDDEKFPLEYYIPGDTRNRTTGCNLEFFRTPAECDDNGQCQTVETSFANSGPEFHPRSGLFCEGHLSLGGRNHNPESPSKHNLLCNEQGTFFTVLRNPDFKHGNNAARKEGSYEDVSFRYVREAISSKVIIAIEISSRMRYQDRYVAVKNAFSHFVLSQLPDRSEVSLIVFGGGDNTSLVTASQILGDEEAKINYLEMQPLPDEPSEADNICIDCVLDEIMNLVKEENSSAPAVVLVTTESSVSRHEEMREMLDDSEIRLHVLSFADNTAPERPSSLYELCSETRNYFVSLEGDILGNLYSAFSDVIKGQSLNVLISQHYIITLDEENIRMPFILDASLSSTLEVSLTGPSFNPSPLEYEKTTLITPGGQTLMPRKMELVPSWVFHVSNPQAGKYTLKTRRKRDGTSPVMLTVAGSSVEDPITARVWVEVLESKVAPPPVQVFAEVKQGPNPVINVTVTAYVHHPGTDGVSRIPLIDDGLGNIDITRDDGIYTHFFTNFTSKGFYNVYIEVTGGSEFYSEILKGPSSVCCGSSFSAKDRNSTGNFRREAGPVTFEVTEINDNDTYPPAMVTDLRIIKLYEELIVLRWTAVGDDFGTGVAAYYEVKLISDRFALRYRYSDSGLEYYSEKVYTTSFATYGTSLYHQLKLPKVTQRGVYYFSVRAVDEAGNVGEPSNAVPVWLKQNSNAISCFDDAKIIAMELISSNQAASIYSTWILVVFAVSSFWLYVLI